MESNDPNLNALLRFVLHARYPPLLFSSAPDRMDERNVRIQQSSTCKNMLSQMNGNILPIPVSATVAMQLGSLQGDLKETPFFSSFPVQYLFADMNQISPRDP